jgi:integrase
MKPDLLAPSTVENIFHYFQTVLCQAHEDGLIPTNECKRVELPQGRKPLRMPTDKEVDLVLEALSDDCYAPAFLASRLGLRAGECWALTREDIDHDNDPPRLHVKKHLVKQRGQRVVKGGTKHHLEGRSVYIVPESGVLPVLAKHMLAYSRSHLIFTRPNGQTMDNQWYNHQWRAAVKATGIKPFTFHDLRSYAVSRFARTRAISLATVAKIMGHTLGTMQDRYLYLFEDTVMDEMAASFTHMAEADERRRLAARGS